MKYTDVREILLNLHNKHFLYSEVEKINIYKDYLFKVKKYAYMRHNIAQYDLAQHYDSIGFFGNPNPFYNVKKMFYWYKKSADNNYIFAYNNLADLYERGVGCNKDLGKALMYYELGMKNGDLLAKNNYKKLKKEINEL